MEARTAACVLILLHLLVRNTPQAFSHFNSSHWCIYVSSVCYSCISRCATRRRPSATLLGRRAGTASWSATCRHVSASSASYLKSLLAYLKRLLPIS